VKISYNLTVAGIKKDRRLMMERHKIGWVFLLSSGIISLTGTGALADKKNDIIASTDASHCHTSLERFCLLLEVRSKQRAHQAYYKNLYRQIRDFLDKNLPISRSQINASQLDKCENLLNVIQDIVGTQGGSVDLAPLPGYSSPRGGKRTTPALETAQRPLRIRSIRYTTDESLVLDVKTVDKEEEGEEPYEFKTSRSASHLPSIRNPDKKMEERE
jgi:hypothetical protein